MNVEAIIQAVLVFLATSAVSAVGGFFFNKYRTSKKERQMMLEASKKLDGIVDEHAAVTVAMKNMIRSSITRVCEEAIHNGCITEDQLRNLCELYESYKGFGNTDKYVDQVFLRVIELPLTGTARNGEDYMQRFDINQNVQRQNYR